MDASVRRKVWGGRVRRDVRGRHGKAGKRRIHACDTAGTGPDDVSTVRKNKGFEHVAQGLP
jgi:hypothetical protein